MKNHHPICVINLINTYSVNSISVNMFFYFWAIRENHAAQNAAPDSDDQHVVRRLFADGDGDDDNTVIVKRKRVLK